MFMDHKRLKFSHKKCHRIHIEKEHNKCPQLKVHDKIMTDAQKEKYLGDIIDESGNIQATIENRIRKGNGIISEISSIIEEFPFGQYKLEVALKLREAMLINGILFNSESWHGVTEKQVKSLEAIDESLLRTIMKAHSKTPKEFLYLESGALPLRFIIAQRRILFMKHITERHDSDLLKRVFVAQREAPSHGDFVKIVEKDLKDLNLTHQYATSSSVSKDQLKAALRKSANNAALNYLRNILKEHTQVKSISYKKLEIQRYLKSSVLSQYETSILTSFRSQCTRGMRSNFGKMYQKSLLPFKMFSN